MIVAWYFGKFYREALLVQIVARGAHVFQWKEWIPGAYEDGYWRLPFRKADCGIAPVQRAGMHYRCGKILGLEQGHIQREHRAAGVSEQVHAAGIDRVFGFDALNKIVQKVRSIYRRGPTRRVHGVRPNNDYRLLCCEVLPLVDQREAIMPRPVKQDHQRRGRSALDGIGRKQIETPLLILRDN